MVLYASKACISSVFPVLAATIGEQDQNSGMTEVHLEDDPPWAMELVLRVAHWKLGNGYETIIEAQLLELSKLGVKYKLKELLHTIAESKKWVLAHKGVNWGSSDIQNFAEITAAFSYDDDCKYLTRKLAIRAKVKDSRLQYLPDGAAAAVFLRKDIPVQIQGKRN